VLNSGQNLVEIWLKFGSDQRTALGRAELSGGGSHLVPGAGLLRHAEKKVFAKCLTRPRDHALNFSHGNRHKKTKGKKCRYNK